MANESARYGFIPYSIHAPTHDYIAGASIAAGDPVTQIDSAGYISVAATTSGSLIGVAANAATVGSTVKVYDHPLNEFKATFISSITVAQSNIGQIYDLSGTTSQFQITTTTTETVIKVLRVVPGEALGTNCQVVVKIHRHQNGGDATA